MVLQMVYLFCVVMSYVAAAETFIPEAGPQQTIINGVAVAALSVALFGQVAIIYTSNISIYKEHDGKLLSYR